MIIYLDTSHLQKWQQKTLPHKELAVLNKLKNSGRHYFVLSSAHIIDISDREDAQKAIEVAKFLDHLPIKWIRNPVDLKREEIKNALKCFNRNQTSEILPFVPDFVDTLEPEPTTALTIPLLGRELSIETNMAHIVSIPIHEREGKLHKNLLEWAQNNAVKLTEKEMQKNFCHVLKDDIQKFKLRDNVIDIVVTELNKIADPIEEFINWLIKNPLLIASVWYPYYIQHFMHRNTDMTWKNSHITDLTHLAALPFVNYLSVDNQIYDLAKQALNFVKRLVPDAGKWQDRLITSVLSIKN